MVAELWALAGAMLQYLGFTAVCLLAFGILRVV